MRGSIWELPRTTGARESHREKGTCCPRINWVAAALKKGSRAASQVCNIKKGATRTLKYKWEEKKRKDAIYILQRGYQYKYYIEGVAVDFS
jgi:hypothetical protein